MTCEEEPKGKQGFNIDCKKDLHNNGTYMKQTFFETKHLDFLFNNMNSYLSLSVSSHPLSLPPDKIILCTLLPCPGFYSCFCIPKIISFVLCWSFSQPHDTIYFPKSYWKSFLSLPVFHAQFLTSYCSSFVIWQSIMSNMSFDFILSFLIIQQFLYYYLVTSS